MRIPATKLSIIIAMSAFIVLAWSADQKTLLDSLSGKVEVRRAGSQKWELAGKGTAFFNNDMVRAQPTSSARLRLPDGNAIYLRANTQILINTYANGQTSQVSEYVTVFFGAAFFLINAALPQGIFKHDVKAYTPTAVIATRGTSFAVDVQQKSGATSVRVTNNTVLVRNILKNVSLFLKAGYQTVVEVNTDPILPKALLDKDILELKQWVTPQVIDHELSMQMANAKRDFQIITGNIEQKVLFLPLENKSQYKGAWTVGASVPKFIADQVNKSLPSIKAEFSDTTGADPLSYGAEKMAHFVVCGTIENIDLTQHVKISPAADDYKEFSTALVRIRLQLIDVKENKQIYENTITGEMTDPQLVLSTWKSVGDLPFNLGDAGFAKTIMGKAVLQVVEKSSDDLCRYMRAE